MINNRIIIIVDNNPGSREELLAILNDNYNLFFSWNDKEALDIEKVSKILYILNNKASRTMLCSVMMINEVGVPA